MSSSSSASSASSSSKRKRSNSHDLDAAYNNSIPDDDFVPCPMCGDLFDLRAINVHAFSCDGTSSSSSSAPSAPALKRSRSAPSPSAPSRPPPSLSCPLCQRTFSTLPSLETHAATCDGSSSSSASPSASASPPPPRPPPPRPLPPPSPSSSSLSPDQERVLSLVLSGKNVFFTGSAGTGKSFLMRVLKQHMERERLSIAMTASTGVAAVNVGGYTIHSWAGIGLGKGTLKYVVDTTYGKSTRHGPYGKLLRNRWTKTRVLVIDEISMISGDLFEKLDAVGKRIRGSSKPFGGLQIVVCGDFFQLPPVFRNTNSSSSTPALKNKLLAFETDAWRECFSAPYGEVVELTTVFRQEDRAFIDLLQSVRIGQCTDEELSQFSDRVLTDAELSTAMAAMRDRGDVVPTRMYPHRRSVDAENTKRLAELRGREEHTFHAHDTARDKGRTRPASAFGDKPPNALKTLQNNCPARENITLRVGAQVMLLRNLDTTGGLVNGTRGVVIGFGQPDMDVMDDGDKFADLGTGTLYPRVRFSCKGGARERVLAPEKWEINEGRVVVAARVQVPLALAWAVTIHKSQGMTLDSAVMDLSHVFESGMMYVALSRLRSLDGLYLLGFNGDAIFTDKRVIQYYQTFSREPRLCAESVNEAPTQSQS